MRRCLHILQNFTASNEKKLIMFSVILSSLHKYPVYWFRFFEHKEQWNNGISTRKQTDHKMLAIIVHLAILYGFFPKSKEKINYWIFMLEEMWWGIIYERGRPVKQLKLVCFQNATNRIALQVVFYIMINLNCNLIKRTKKQEKQNVFVKNIPSSITLILIKMGSKIITEISLN